MPLKREGRKVTWDFARKEPLKESEKDPKTEGFVNKGDKLQYFSFMYQLAALWRHLPGHVTSKTTLHAGYMVIVSA